MTTDYKDILIQLLLEKVEAKQTPLTLTASNVALKTRKKAIDRHAWTREEKMAMLRMDAEGVAEGLIAERLGLRKAQVEAMLYSIKSGRANI
jgi:hypothetical protein